MTEEAFLAACVAEPDEPAHRLALADWLEEQGDARARWARDADVFPWTLPDLSDPVPRLIEALPEGEAERVLVKLGREAVPALLIASIHRVPGTDRVLELMRTPEIERLLGQYDWSEADEIHHLERLARIGEPAAVLVPELAASFIGSCSEAVEEALIGLVERLGQATPAALRTVWQYRFLSPSTLAPRLCDAAVRFGPHPTIVDALVPWVSSYDDTCPENRALEALAERSSEVVELLIERLEGDGFAPETLASALGVIGPRAALAVPSLLPLLDDDSSEVVVAATEALGRIGPAASAAVPRLRILAKPGCPARDSAVAALTAITGRP